MFCLETSQHRRVGAEAGRRPGNQGRRAEARGIAFECGLDAGGTRRTTSYGLQQPPANRARDAEPDDPYARSPIERARRPRRAPLPHAAQPCCAKGKTAEEVKPKAASGALPRLRDFAHVLHRRVHGFGSATSAETAGESAMAGRLRRRMDRLLGASSSSTCRSRNRSMLSPSGEDHHRAMAEGPFVRWFVRSRGMPKGDGERPLELLGRAQPRRTSSASSTRSRRSPVVTTPGGVPATRPIRRRASAPSSSS